ncbi:hypothetical protein L226DRAFT_616977 [Lentinus tigrinus ALCF2SS1-7]|uniref:Alpha/beta-hydrolase n=1 Tax=Lentinus tigrinus ALCF2SS1-6 TaxID=1328759 RepID=A0A5C2RUU9_9APHY|nr:hypothetical protein L227DRAFT_580580 [Lentinus tigrinus ALCF2SS1-6]RPD69309.1 hypothetical protein L226DRAFT_616977 [Lentinus tigrinus ALCF2SS1-7]
MKKQTLNVAGITVNVFSLEEEQGEGAEQQTAKKPVAMMFLLHGRTSKADHIELVAKAFLDEVYQRRKAGEGKGEGEGAGDRQEVLDLWIVTFDHRNHGSRTVDDLANQAWSDNPSKSNQQHAIDMYAIQTGTAQDVTSLIDFLPWYLFPNEEREIKEWIVSGISLGGHSTWIALKNDPRVKVGIPIIGCPDYLALIVPRAEASKIPIEPPYFPKSFLEFVKTHDPVATPHTADKRDTNPFRGKKILVLSGKEDEVVPWAASKQFVEELDTGEEEEGVKEVFVEPGVGHTCSPKMVKMAVRFLWERVLTTAPADTRTAAL